MVRKQGEIDDNLPTGRETKRSIEACKKYLGRSPLKVWKKTKKQK